MFSDKFEEKKFMFLSIRTITKIKKLQFCPNNLEFYGTLH